MTSPALRFTLLVVFVGLIAGAAYVLWQENAEGSRIVERGRAVDERIAAAARALLEIKGAQSGYVAAGQAEDAWVGRVDALLGATRDALGDLETRAESEAARRSIATAAGALRDFEQMDRRARSYARSGQRLLASDLVFSDGVEKIDLTVAALERARAEERAADEARLLDLRRAQLFALLGATAGSLLVVLILVPVPKRADGTAVAASVPQEPDSLPLRAPVPAPDAAPAPGIGPEPASTAPVAAAPAENATVDLPAIATLCTDLARVLDRQALPSALARAAELLRASGIVVWVADPDGRELVPVMAHGYPQHLVIRLGRIDRDAENVTAAAYRTGVMQTVSTGGGSPGAIAAPLIGMDGPVGVMAAEVLDEAERQEATCAAAAIIAAQLATLMGPPTVRGQAAAEAAGA